MKQDMSGVAAAGLLAAIVFGVLAYADHRSRVSAAADAAAVTVRPATAPYVPVRYTTDEFSRLVYGQTKADVRERLGTPDQVIDSGRGWYYFQLPVYDADAGAQVSVTILFTGYGGSDDKVVEVRY